MLVIAERINATRSRIARALKERDSALIAEEARRQAEVGADFIDVNAASNPAQEAELLAWAVGVVQQSTDRPICLDSANPQALEAGLELIEGDAVMVNSVTLEEGRPQAVLPLAAKHGARLIALTMDEKGLPKTTDERVQIAGRLVEAAESAGVPRERLYIDPCVQPVSTSPEQGLAVLEAVERIMGAYPGIHTTCGLSNISFGLPRRGLLNRIYLAALVMAGLDSAIIDPTASGMMDSVLAAEALAGRDEFCMNYLQAMR